MDNSGRAEDACVDTQLLLTGKGFTVVSADLICSESFNPFKCTVRMSRIQNNYKQKNGECH